MSKAECGMTAEQIYQEAYFADVCRESGIPEQIRIAEVIERKHEKLSTETATETELRAGIEVEPNQQIH